MSEIHSSELIHLWRPPTPERPGIDTDLFDVVYKSNVDAIAEAVASAQNEDFPFDPEMMLAERIEPFEIDLLRLFGTPCTVLSWGVQLLMRGDEWRPVFQDEPGIGVRGRFGHFFAFESDESPRPDFGFEILDAHVSLQGLGRTGSDYRTEVAFQPITNAGLLRYVETVKFEIDLNEEPEQ